MNELFHKIAVRVSYFAGSPITFMGAIFIIIFWGFSGSAFNFSDTWQLVINTGTTIVTFLMVFLIQNTQNRDSKTIQLKLDELLKGVKGASAGFIDIEDLPDDELEKFHDEFKKLHEHYAEELIKRRQRRLKKTSVSSKTP